MVCCRQEALFGRGAKYTQVAAFVLDGEITADGFIIGDGDIQAVGLVVDFVDEIIKHGGGKQEGHGKIGAVGYNAHVGIKEAAKLKNWYFIECPTGHATQAAEGDGIFLLDCAEPLKPLLAVHPHGINCPCVNHGVNVMELIQPDYGALIFFYQFQCHLLQSLPHPQISTCP